MIRSAVSLSSRLTWKCNQQTSVCAVHGAVCGDGVICALDNGAAIIQGDGGSGRRSLRSSCLSVWSPVLSITPFTCRPVPLPHGSCSRNVPPSVCGWKGEWMLCKTLLESPYLKKCLRNYLFNINFFHNVDFSFNPEYCVSKVKPGSHGKISKPISDPILPFQQS